MATTTRSLPQGERLEDAERRLPPLETGDRLDQKTFHARYEAMPAGTRAELIGGVVIMPSPLKTPHGEFHAELTSWLAEYKHATPGTRVAIAASTILGPKSEPQPDLSLRISRERGGQTDEKDQYITGAPELVAEVASSTESYDLHDKKADYERAGVKEYLVVALRQQQVFWLVAREKTFEPLPPGADGIYRSHVFPGLWLDPAAFLQEDNRRVLEILRQGLASAEHADFVAKLAQLAN